MSKDTAGSDVTRLYLNDIGQVDLLTADQEKDIGRRIQRGLVAADELTKAVGKLERSERTKQKDLVKDGEQAQIQMVNANLRLVVSVARRYDRKGLQLDDLIQDGNIGLIHAVKKYDPEKGFKFSTYATWWIRQAITRALADQGRNIRIPGHMMEIVNRIQRSERDLTAELSRPPTPEEVAKRSNLTVHEVLDIMQLSMPISSLDAPVGANTDDLTIGDTIASDEENDPLDSTIKSQLRAVVEQTLGDLPERDQEILAMRFGIGQFDRSYTLNEVADVMKVTRERVRQIEQKALARLRHPHNSGNLRAFRDNE